MTVMQWLQAIAAGALVYGILRVAIPSPRKRVPDAARQHTCSVFTGPVLPIHSCGCNAPEQDGERHAPPL